MDRTIDPPKTLVQTGDNPPGLPNDPSLLEWESETQQQAALPFWRRVISPIGDPKDFQSWGFATLWLLSTIAWHLIPFTPEFVRLLIFIPCALFCVAAIFVTLPYRWVGVAHSTCLILLNLDTYRSSSASMLAVYVGAGYSVAILYAIVLIPRYGMRVLIPFMAFFIFPGAAYLYFSHLATIHHFNWFFFGIGRMFAFCCLLWGLSMIRHDVMGANNGSRFCVAWVN